MAENMTKDLWEIMVPATWNNGKKVDVAHHHIWDKLIRNISGGLTILKTARGEWVSPQGKVFREKMIPVRIACTEEQIDKIIEITIAHYVQEAIMAYRISDCVKIVNKED